MRGWRWCYARVPTTREGKWLLCRGGLFRRMNARRGGRGRIAVLRSPLTNNPPPSPLPYPPTGHLIAVRVGVNECGVKCVEHGQCSGSGGGWGHTCAWAHGIGSDRGRGVTGGRVNGTQYRDGGYWIAVGSGICTPTGSDIRWWWTKGGVGSFWPLMDTTRGHGGAGVVHEQRPGRAGNASGC